MRSKHFSLVVLCVLATTTPATAQPLIQFKSRELHEGRNFIKSQIAVPEVAEASGQITYTYPIELPQGRGVTPKVELQYSSGAKFSEYGYGWELTLPTIARTQRFGVVDYNANLFVYRNGQESEELVPTGVTTALGGAEYKERVERTFQRYLFYAASNQWRILTPNGVRYEVGPSNASRRGSNPNTGPSGTAEWLVSRMIDTNNNYVTYTYGPGATRAARIASIAYGGNAATGVSPQWTVTFNWSVRFESTALGFRSGFARVFGEDHLDGVVVSVPRHASTNPATVPTSSPTTRTYQFTYSTNTASTDAMFTLQTAQLVGMPPVTFLYSNPSNDPVVDREVLVDGTGQDLPGDLGFTAVSNGTSSTRRVLVDATRDAQLDLVDATSDDDDLWTVWVTSNGVLQRSFWDAPLDLVNPMPDRHALRVVKDGKTVQDFFDLDGDGFPDLVWVVTDGATVIKYCPGNGHGFDSCTVFGAAAPGAGILRETVETASTDTSVTDLDITDMNGDGLPDVVKLVGTQLQIYLNLGVGPGFSTTAIVSTMPACPVAPLASACLRATEDVIVTGGNRRLVADLRDVNGDGLPDYVISTSTGELQIAYGTGRAFRPFVATGIFLQFGIGTQDGTGGYSTFDDMVDINGDGLVDFVEMNCAGSTYNVWFNNGGMWDPTPRVYQASLALSGHESACGDREQPAKWNGEDGIAIRTKLVDFNGDGNADFVSAPYDVGETPSVRLGQRDYRAPRLLETATSLSGNHQLDVSWSAPVTAVPMPIHVPTSVARAITPLYTGQPVRAISTLMAYTFDGGSFDAANREFAGFFTVTAVGPPWGTTSTTTYGTTLVQRGLVLARSVRNNSAAGIEEDLVNFYTYLDLGNGRSWARLDERESGPPPTPELPVPSSVTLFKSYDAFGHPTQWIEYGRQLVAGDEYINERDYLTRVDDDFMLSVVAAERRQSGDTMTGTPITTRKYYDDHTTFGLPPTAGNVVKVQRALDGSNVVTTEFFYDANGNVTKELDEAGVATTYTYDPSFARFQVTETNPVGTTYRSFHALSATKSDECGPQYSGSSYRCSRVEVDTYGRETAQWVPKLSGATYVLAQLTSVTYQDNTYPLSTTVLKRGIAHSVQYRDGFGNATQVRLEETAGTYRVYDSSVDADGNAFRVERPYRESGSAYVHAPPSSEAWTYDYDPVHVAIERVTHPRDPGQLIPATSTRVVGPDRTIAIDEDGREIDYVQDAYRRVTTVRRYDGTTHADTAFEYDPADKIVEMIDAAGNGTKWARNLVGWVMAFEPPDGAEIDYTYDPRGLVLTTRDPRNVTVHYSYDTAGRLASLDGTGSSTIRAVKARLQYYTAAVDSKQLGWLQTETSDSITQTYQYDPEHTLVGHTSAMGTFGGQVSLAYDIGGRLSHIHYPDGRAITYTYDLLDQPTKITEDATAATLAQYLYEDDGQISVVTNAFGLDENNTYDARGRRTAVVSTNTALGAGSLVDDVVTLSPAGDVSSLTRNGLLPGGVPRSMPDVFDIRTDAFHQVTEVDRNGSLDAFYAYDGAGRITTFNETGSSNTSTTTFTADHMTDRVTGSTEQLLSYDQAGEVVADGLFISGTARERAHYWDSMQRYTRTAILGGTATDYYYTALGRIARVTQPGELPNKSDELYVGDWARLDMTYGTWTDQLSANGLLVMEMTGVRHEMPHRTIQQTVAAVSDDTGAIVRQEEFAPFGTRRDGSPQGGFEQHFHGMRNDEVLVTGGRAYDSEIGGWLSRDFAHRDPQKLLEDIRLVNGYAFVASNPFAERDPSGLGPDDTEILYVAPKDEVTDKGKTEYRWSIAAEAQRKEYEAALGKFLVDKGVVKKGAKTEYHQLSTIKDVSSLADKNFGSVVLLVHGLGDRPDIAVILPSSTAGTEGDHQNASQFATQIAGSGWTTITILGCDTVQNGFAPNLATNVAKGGTVKGYSGNLLELKSHFDFSKTPGLLTLKSIHLPGKTTSLGLQNFATGPKATKP